MESIPVPGTVQNVNSYSVVQHCILYTAQHEDTYYLTWLHKLLIYVSWIQLSLSYLTMSSPPLAGAHSLHGESASSGQAVCAPEPGSAGQEW